MTPPSSVPVATLPDPDRAAQALADGSHPRLAGALAAVLADAGEHPFDGFVHAAARRLAVQRDELAAAVAEVDAVDAGPGAAPFVARVVSAAARFTRLTTRLTEYAEACGPVHVEEVDVGALLDRVTDRLVATDRPAPADVTVTGPALPLDASRAALVLEHLLANAAAYAGGPVSVTARREVTGWSLVVADHGPGIPTADRVRVLAPLVRLDRDRAVPGDGMGLAVCARVMRAHDGMVFVNRTAGGGTSVRLVGGLR